MENSSFFRVLQNKATERIRLLTSMRNVNNFMQADQGLALLLEFHLTQTFQSKSERELYKVAFRYLGKLRANDFTFLKMDSTPYTQMLNAPSAVELIAQLEQYVHKTLFEDCHQFFQLIEPANNLFMKWRERRNDCLTAMKDYCIKFGMEIQKRDPFDYQHPSVLAQDYSGSSEPHPELRHNSEDVAVDQIDNSRTTLGSQEQAPDICMAIVQGEGVEELSFKEVLSNLHTRDRWSAVCYVRGLVPRGLDLLEREIDWECTRAAMQFPGVIPGSLKAPVTIGKDKDAPVRVCGKRKQFKTENEYLVIQALLEAFPDGLTKDQIERDVSNARSVLRKLRNDSDWDKVICMPGKRGIGGYCLIQPQ